MKFSYKIALQWDKKVLAIQHLLLLHKYRGAIKWLRETNFNSHFPKSQYK